MKKLSGLALCAVCGLFMLAGAPEARAQVAVSIGAAPECPYGYYDYPPYACAPYGYYGPEWFPGGIFIGAGPWFHGAANFRGHVNNHFDVHHGYKGALPQRGQAREASRHPEQVAHFKGNEMRDGRGHVSNGHVAKR